MHLKNNRVLRFKLLLYFLHGNPLLHGIAKFLLHHWSAVRKFENIEKHALTSPEHIRFIYNIPQSLKYSYPIFDFEHIHHSPLINIQGFNKYAAELTKAFVIGGSGLILQDNHKAFYDIKYNDKKGRFRYYDEAIQLYDNDYCLIKTKYSNITLNEGIFLGGNFSWNYYHFIFEVLVKFDQINALQIDLKIPLLIDKICTQIPQFWEIFNLLNTKGRKYCVLDKGKRYLVNRLFIFSCPNVIPPAYLNEADARAEDFLYDVKSLDYLRNTLLGFSKEHDFPKRIFISRSKASSRRKFNEDEVFMTLAKYGFKRVFPEDYSFAEQISLFNQAEFIAGGSGAAFSNLLFCNRSCKVICFTNYKLPVSIFSTIASHLEFKLLYISDEMKKSSEFGDIHDAFNIDINRLNNLVSQWISM